MRLGQGAAQDADLAFTRQKPETWESAWVFDGKTGVFPSQYPLDIKKELFDVSSLKSPVFAK